MCKKWVRFTRRKKFSHRESGFPPVLPRDPLPQPRHQQPGGEAQGRKWPSGGGRRAVPPAGSSPGGAVWAAVVASPARQLPCEAGPFPPSLKPHPHQRSLSLFEEERTSTRDKRRQDDSLFPGEEKEARRD